MGFLKKYLVITCKMVVAERTKADIPITTLIKISMALSSCFIFFPPKFEVY